MTIRIINLNRSNNQNSMMPPKKQQKSKQPSVTITSSGRTIKPRVELETYSSLDEESYSDTDSDTSIPSLAPSSSRKMSVSKGGSRKRNVSATSSVSSSMANSKEYLEKRARNNDAVRRSRQRRKEKQMEAQQWLDTSNNQRKKLGEMDKQLDDEMAMLKLILSRGLEDPTVNLSKFLSPDCITKLMMQSA